MIIGNRLNLSVTNRLLVRVTRNYRIARFYGKALHVTFMKRNRKLVLSNKGVKLVVGRRLKRIRYKASRRRIRRRQRRKRRQYRRRMRRRRRRRRLLRRRRRRLRRKKRRSLLRFVLGGRPRYIYSTRGRLVFRIRNKIKTVR